MKAYVAPVGLLRAGGLLPIGAQVLVEPDGEALSLAWRQRGLMPKPVLIINPKEKPSGLLPRKWVTLVFTKKPTKEWAKWLKSPDVELVEKPGLTKDQMRHLLMSGALPFKLTAEAADFAVEDIGENEDRFFETAFTLEMLLDNDNGVLDMDALVEAWPGVGLKTARDITKVLGKVEALSILLSRVSRDDSDSIFGLWRYLEILCNKRFPERLWALAAYRNACDRLKFDYYEGLVLFLHYCYKESTWPSKSPKTGTSNSPRRSTPLQDLCRQCGLSFSGSGNTPV